MKPRFSDIEFFTLASMLVKTGRLADAANCVHERLKIDGRSPYIFGLHGAVGAAAGNPREAVLGFLYAYAQSRNPFYKRQLENVLPKFYGDSPPCILNSVDFVSFFQQRNVKIQDVDFGHVTRDVPDFLGNLEGSLPSTLFEQMLADRGVWMAEDRDLEVIYSPHHHSLLTTDDILLIEKMSELPPYAEGKLFDQMAEAAGTIGIFSAHVSSRTVLCRKNTLPVHTIDESCGYIGGSSNTGHFLLDFLPKVESYICNATAFDLPVYTYKLSGIFQEMTKSLFPEIRFVDIEAKIPEPALLHFKHVQVPSYVPAGFAFPILRQRAERAGLTRLDPNANKRVYLSRGIEFRRLTNEDELVARLAGEGFVAIDSMQTSFAEMVAIMANAEIIVTGTGAQISYIPFCRPGTAYVELLPDAYAADPKWRFNDRIYSHSHLNYHPMPCPTENASVVQLKFDWLYRCDVDAVMQKVMEIIAPQNTQPMRVESSRQ